MQYRTFGKKVKDFRPSALGFGAMRLPILNEDTAQINETEAIRMIRYAIDHGVNYVDSAYAYHGGKSEIVVGKALKDGYRQKTRLATKLPTYLLKTEADTERFLDEQLKKLDVDHIDFYLLHALGKSRWEACQQLKVLDVMARALADGRIRHLGFSFHDDLAAFKTIIDGSDMWEFCQIQYNYMDVERQAGTEGLRYAASKGLGVVIMEPLLGGRLANTHPPEAIQRIWDAAPVRRSPAEWGLQWVWNQPEVSVVLSGMSSFEQVVQNVESAGRSGVDSFTPPESAVIDKVRETYRALQPIACTACNYCQPCPSNIPIPEHFARYNDAVAYNAFPLYRRGYSRMDETKKANACAVCRECLDKCPQHLEIPDLLVEVHRVLGENQDPSRLS